jgi:hypothetical protein
MVRSPVPEEVVVSSRKPEVVLAAASGLVRPKKWGDGLAAMGY